MKFLELRVLPVFVFLFFAGAIWVIHDIFPAFTVSFAWKSWVAVVLFALGGFFGVGGLFEFYKYKTSIEPNDPYSASRLVTTGVYRISRNPMYLALLFVLAGLTVYLTNFLNPFLLIGFVIYINYFQIIPEERVLTEKFRDEFTEYKKSVRRWI